MKQEFNMYLQRVHITQYSHGPVLQSILLPFAHEGTSGSCYNNHYKLLAKMVSGCHTDAHFGLGSWKLHLIFYNFKQRQALRMPAFSVYPKY